MNTVRKAQVGVVVVAVIAFLIGVGIIMQPSEKQKTLDALQHRLDVAQSTMATCEQAHVPFQSCKLASGVQVGDEISQVKAEMTKLG